MKLCQIYVLKLLAILGITNARVTNKHYQLLWVNSMPELRIGVTSCIEKSYKIIPELFINAFNYISKTNIRVMH